MMKMEGEKSSKIDPKMTSYKLLKKRLKIDFHGGVQNGKNRSNLTGGSGGAIFINFLKFRTFLQKLPPF
jgi:hypothetical protein